MRQWGRSRAKAGAKVPARREAAQVVEVRVNQREVVSKKVRTFSGSHTRKSTSLTCLSVA